MNRPRGEQGAVAIVVALVVCFVMLPLAAYTVDIGAQRVLRRDMQSLADVVALDMSRQLDGSTKQAILQNSNHWREPIAQSVAANLNLALNQAPGVGLTDVTVSPAEGADSVAAIDGTPLTVRVSMGTVDATGHFSTIGNQDIPDAVQVIASSSMAGSFYGISGGAIRTAVARNDSEACYSAGSFALGLATNKSILAAVLGDTAAARVVSYQGLADADVSLLGLATAPQIDVGTPDQLLTAQNVTVADVLDASAVILAANGDTAGAELATQLGQIKADLGPLAAEHVDFGQLLDLGQASSAVDAEINVLDLLTGGLIVANGVNAVAVPDLNLSIPGLGNLTARLTITAAPKIACNGGASTSAQGFVELSGTLNVSVLGTGVRLQNVAARVSLANATAKLSGSVACSATSLPLDVSNQTLANVRLTADAYLTLLGIPTVKVARIDTGAPSSAANATYQLPLPDSYTTPVTTDSGSVGLDLTNTDVQLLGVLNVGALVSALAPLVNGVNGLLTGTLLPALGITTAGADLWAMPTVTCGTPQLVG